MILTNQLNLPQAIVKAVTNDPYSKGHADYSITELLLPPRLRALRIAHKDELTEDVKDRLWSLYGQIAHLILERANMVDLAEKRFFTEIAGKIVSGQMDTLCLDSGVLSDYKFTTSYGFVTGRAAKREWCQQLNCQAYLLRIHGYSLTKLQIIGLLRDWQIRDAKRDLTYPSAPIAIHDIEVWNDADVKAFMEDRIKTHEAALGDLPQCTKEETWNGRRCESYCPVNDFCDQYKQRNRGK